MEYYIFSTDSLNDFIGVCDSQAKLIFEIEYANNEQTNIYPEKGDMVLVYRRAPISCVTSLLEVLENHNGKMQLKKVLDVAEGAEISEPLVSAKNLAINDFVKINENEYQQIVCGMVQKLKVKYSLDISEDNSEIINNEFPEPDCPHNRIISGAPGTGKSYSLEEDRKEYFGRENLYNRVTFHPAYSYAQFFGCFKPISKMKNGEKEIEYSFVPGPFVTTLLKALAEPEKNFLLIIEEINRANVAAVFGDVFQLLDRDDSGKSEYAISISDELMEYINDGFGKELLNDVDVKEQKIRIPANMYIWATMNSADQGVMPMDTAFKRRWDFEYIGIDDGEEFIKDVNVRIQLKDGMQEFNWNELRKQINENLKVHGDEIPEDKLLGPFFIQKYILDMVEQDAGASEAFVKAFKNKVLMYLFDDVARYNLDYVFDTESIPGTAGLSDILAAFDEKGVNIIAGFTADIIPNDEDAEGGNLEEEVEPTADGV